MPFCWLRSQSQEPCFFSDRSHTLHFRPGHDFSASLKQAGDHANATKYAADAARLAKQLRARPSSLVKGGEWWEDYGVHAAAYLVNARVVATPAEEQVREPHAPPACGVGVPVRSAVLRRAHAVARGPTRPASRDGPAPPDGPARAGAVQARAHQRQDHLLVEPLQSVRSNPSATNMRGCVRNRSYTCGPKRSGSLLHGLVSPARGTRGKRQCCPSRGTKAGSAGSRQRSPRARAPRNAPPPGTGSCKRSATLARWSLPWPPSSSAGAPCSRSARCAMTMHLSCELGPERSQVARTSGTQTVCGGGRMPQTRV